MSSAEFWLQFDHYGLLGWSHHSFIFYHFALQRVAGVLELTFKDKLPHTHSNTRTWAINPILGGGYLEIETDVSAWNQSVVRLRVPTAAPLGTTAFVF